MDPEWDGKPEGDNTLFSVISAGYDFLDTMKIELLAGRDFSAWCRKMRGSSS